MKRKFYFFQVNYPYGKSAHLPYTAGQLSAYAFADKDVADGYSLENIFFLRESVDGVMAKISNPFLVAFSTYIWNCNFNKAVAKKIKEKYPECKIVFGGHHISPDGSMLDECPYIDYLLHGEGEIILRRLMRALIGLDSAENIPGITFRTPDGIVTNPQMISNECDFPSPYTNGYFDKILAENPDTEFMALIETSRGCPNSCAYCDWSNMKSKIRQFPLERVYADIDWISRNKVYGLGSADSNFGMFKRDMEITDKIVKAKKETGYPVRFQTSYAKNSTKTVFDIGMKLEESRLNKGITLSFQSMSDEVLKNIGRENISIEYYSELMRMYNEAGVATYTELILGLPGETYESIVDGIDKLLTLGQHNSIYVHNCEWLPCSIMGQKDYVEKYQIKVSHIPLNQPHREADAEDEIPECSSIVTQTYSMTQNDWKMMNLFSAAVQCFHHMGLVQFFALYLYNEKICSYKDFYTSLLEFVLKNPSTVIGKAFVQIRNSLDDVTNEKGTPNCVDRRFGNVMWTFEEYAYLCAVYETDKFFDEIKPFLSSYFEDADFFEHLFDFQKRMLKQPFSDRFTLNTEYDFSSYFNNLLNGKSATLVKKSCCLNIESKPFSSWKEFARIVAWYGRKDSNCTYIKQTARH